MLFMLEVATISTKSRLGISLEEQHTEAARNKVTLCGYQNLHSYSKDHFIIYTLCKAHVSEYIVCNLMIPGALLNSFSEGSSDDYSGACQ